MADGELLWLCEPELCTLLDLSKNILVTDVRSYIMKEKIVDTSRRALKTKGAVQTKTKILAQRHTQMRTSLCILGAGVMEKLVSFDVDIGGKSSAERRGMSECEEVAEAGTTMKGGGEPVGQVDGVGLLLTGGGAQNRVS